MNDAIMTALAARYAVTPSRVHRWLREIGSDAAWDPRRCDGCDKDASAVGREQRARCVVEGCACEGKTTVEIRLHDGSKERMLG